MEEKLITFLNDILFKFIKNKELFKKWMLIKSKWFCSFIRRGYKNEEWRGKNLKTIKWWITREGLENEWNGNGWIYALLCMKTGDWYIGSTKRSLEERLKEHLYEANRVWEKEKMERTALHKAMWRTRCTNWIMIPLRKMTEEKQLRDLERLLIRKLKPNLNRQLKKEEKEKGKRRRPNKEERKRKMKEETEKELPALWCWSWEEYETFNFKDVIEKTRTLITWTEGMIDGTNWKELRRDYRIEVKVDDNFGGIKFLKKKLKEKRNGTFKIITCTKKDKEWLKRIRDIMKRDLDKLSEETLIKIWRRRDMFKRDERSKITRRLNKELVRRRENPFPNKITLRIPRYYDIGKREVYKEIHQWIRKLKVSKQWKKLLTEEIKIVEIRNKTIGEMFLNYREYARSDWFKINKCVCLEKKTDGRDKVSHEIWKMEDKEEIFQTLTTKTVIPPNGRRENRIIKKELNKLQSIIKKIMNCEGIEKPRIRFRSQKLEQNLMEIKKKWEGWIIIERDKNNGTMAAACPMWYRNKLLETFDWTKWRANYQRIKKEEKEILKQWKKETTKMECKMR